MNPHLLPLALACALTAVAFLIVTWFVADVLDPRGGSRADHVVGVMMAGMALSAAATVGLVLTAAWQAAL